MTDGRRELNIRFNGIVAISILLGLSLGCSRMVTPPGRGLFGKHAEENQGWDPPRTNSQAQTAQFGDQEGAELASSQQTLDSHFAGSYRVPPKTPPKLIPIEPIPFPGDLSTEIATVANFSDGESDSQVTQAASESEIEAGQQNQVAVQQAVATNEVAATEPGATGTPDHAEHESAEVDSVAQTMDVQPESSSLPSETATEFAASDYHQTNTAPAANADRPAFTPAEFSADRRTSNEAETESEICCLSESKRELINKWMTLDFARSSDPVDAKASEVDQTSKDHENHLGDVTVDPDHFNQQPSEQSRSSQPNFRHELDAAGIKVDINAFDTDAPQRVAPKQNAFNPQPPDNFNAAPLHKPSVTSYDPADANHAMETMKKAGSLVASSFAALRNPERIGWCAGRSPSECKEPNGSKTIPANCNDFSPTTTTKPDFQPAENSFKPNANFVPLNPPMSLQPQVDFNVQRAGLTLPTNQTVVQANTASAQFQPPTNNAQLATNNSPLEEPPLRLVNSQFCTEIKGYGQVVPFPSMRFSGNQRTLVYCEVENFESEQKQTDSGTVFSTRFQGRFEIVDSNGRTFQSGNLPEIEDRSNRKRRDFYLYFPVTFKNLSPGEYTLNLSVDERLTNSSQNSSNGPATQSIRFTITQ